MALRDLLPAYGVFLDRTRRVRPPAGSPEVEKLPDDVIEIAKGLAALEEPFEEMMRAMPGIAQKVDLFEVTEEEYGNLPRPLARGLYVFVAAGPLNLFAPYAARIAQGSAADFIPVGTGSSVTVNNRSSTDATPTLALTIAGIQAAGTGMKFNTAVVAGKTYLLSLDVRAIHTQWPRTRMDVVFLDAAGSQVGSTIPGVASYTDQSVTYTREATVKVPAGASRLEVIYATTASTVDRTITIKFLRLELTEVTA